jgi:hypothetical protein
MRELLPDGVTEVPSEEAGEATLASLLGTVLSCRAVAPVDARWKLCLSKQDLNRKEHRSVAEAAVSTSSLVTFQSVVSRSKDRV